ncbi:unnamed protein product [Notodromas monacha]|uniref:SH3 domain-containing protein n=1 Tax=Notodromas monacha TaxID=399045 RepID=A0A7R9BHF4_9CRUS|nr:unnamed protein product [Notodromas monacha]CAG0913976.1 unnamed protein product [Notodromas monacha]
MAFLCPVRIRRSKKKKRKLRYLLRLFSVRMSKRMLIPNLFLNIQLWFIFSLFSIMFKCTFLDGETMDDIRVGLGNSGVAAPHLGRITGSASIETLVRVGLEKEHGLSPDSKMVVLHDFKPCVDDELKVKRGSIVNVLYQENDWVYVIGEGDVGEGFIPHSYCAPFGSPMADLALNVKHKKIPRADPNVSVASESHHLNTTIGTLNHSMIIPGQENSDNESYLDVTAHKQNTVHESQCSLQSGGSSQPETLPFFKDPSGRFLVLYTFIARDENDVSVEKGEFVTVLNREDPEWYWIVRSNGQEGFIPSAFVYPAKLIGAIRNTQGTGGGHVQAQKPATTYSNQGAIINPVSGQRVSTQEDMNASFAGPVENSVGSGHHGPGATDADVARCQGTELVMLYEYKAQAPDDLSVGRGDWVYADLNNQTVDGWLWAYAPKTRKYGFIPRAYARPPATTSL